MSELELSGPVFPEHWQCAVGAMLAPNYFSPPSRDDHVVREVVAFHASTAPEGRVFHRMCEGAPWVRFS